MYYGSLRDLVGSLQEAKTKGQLRPRLRVLTRPAFLVVDEIGYLPVTRNGTTLLLHLISERWSERARCGPQARGSRNGTQALRQVPARKNPEQGTATPAETPR